MTIRYVETDKEGLKLQFVLLRVNGLAIVLGAKEELSEKPHRELRVMTFNQDIAQVANHVRDKWPPIVETSKLTFVVRGVNPTVLGCIAILLGLADPKGEAVMGRVASIHEDGRHDLMGMFVTGTYTFDEKVHALGRWLRTGKEKPIKQEPGVRKCTKCGAEHRGERPRCPICVTTLPSCEPNIKSW